MLPGRPHPTPKQPAHSRALVRIVGLPPGGPERVHERRVAAGEPLLELGGRQDEHAGVPPSPLLPERVLGGGPFGRVREPPAPDALVAQRCVERPAVLRVQPGNTLPRRRVDPRSPQAEHRVDGGVPDQAPGHVALHDEVALHAGVRNGLEGSVPHHGLDPDERQPATVHERVPDHAVRPDPVQSFRPLRSGLDGEREGVDPRHSGGEGLSRQDDGDLPQSRDTISEREQVALPRIGGVGPSACLDPERRGFDPHREQPVAGIQTERALPVPTAHVEIVPLDRYQGIARPHVDALTSRFERDEAGMLPALDPPLADLAHHDPRLGTVRAGRVLTHTLARGGEENDREEGRVAKHGVPRE